MSERYNEPQQIDILERALAAKEAEIVVLNNEIHTLRNDLAAALGELQLMELAATHRLRQG